MSHFSTGAPELRRTARWAWTVCAVIVAGIVVVSNIRLRSLKEIGRAAVISVGDGMVLRVRDGVPDRGSLFRFRLLDPGRTPILEVEIMPVEGGKANYLAYVGGTQAGVYDLQVELLVGAQMVQWTTWSFEFA